MFGLWLGGWPNNPLLGAPMLFDRSRTHTDMWNARQLDGMRAPSKKVRLSWMLVVVICVQWIIFELFFLKKSVNKNCILISTPLIYISTFTYQFFLFNLKLINWIKKLNLMNKHLIYYLTIFKILKKLRKYWWNSINNANLKRKFWLKKCS